MLPNVIEAFRCRYISLNLLNHGHFLKLTCDMEPSDVRTNIRDTTWGIFQIR